MPAFERELTGNVLGAWIAAHNPRGPGLVVLGGSSGVTPVERARLLAGVGVHAIALQWFGGPGQPPGICEVPIETITAAVDLLVAHGCSRVGLLGASKGAEASLLARAVDPRVSAVFAFSPTSVVWANVGPGKDGYGWPLRSSFTWRGKPFAFVPHAAEAMLAVRQVPPIRYLGLFEESLRAFPDRLAAAQISAEAVSGHTVLVAGADDQLWPSAFFAEELCARGKGAGASPRLLTHPAAGHRILLPGETTPRSTLNEHGGTDEADAALGRAAWAELLRWIGSDDEL